VQNSLDEFLLLLIASQTSIFYRLRVITMKGKTAAQWSELNQIEKPLCEKKHRRPSQQTATRPTFASTTRVDS
jgi:hypothetical protein